MSRTETQSLMAAAELRNHAIELARCKPVHALDAAQRIQVAWYRAQALAHVARFASPELAETAFAQCMESARQGKDAYQRAAVLAWPLRAAIETGREETAVAIMEDARERLARIELYCSRAEAFDLVFQSAFAGPRRLWGPLLADLSALCPPGSHWRADRLYRLITAILNRWDGHSARRFVETIPTSKTKTTCERDIEKHKKHAARGFF